MRFGGYCFLLSDRAAHNAPYWAVVRDEEWEVVMDSRSVAVRKLGARYIDGALCVAFECDDGRVRAIKMDAARAMEQKEQLR
jgi:hypothetical protein